MTRMPRGTWAISISLALLPMVSGCGGDEAGPASASQSGAAQPGPNPGGPGAPGAKSSPEIKQIMVKLAKGPNSLTPILGNGLKAEPPVWATIQGQAKEYAELAGDLSKYDPPKGSKESWAKFTGEYAASASDLDKASQAKDKDAALAAHGQLANSCNACHRSHRAMGPGMGGMMGRPGFGPGGPGGPGGPPPGGPGGPGGGPPPGGEPPK
ncbi:MAG: hypothetical protein JWN86_1450 [Planctomycetota bacterium]|nr:hypothetical protein [Planctomycetota bacterium]